MAPITRKPRTPRKRISTKSKQRAVKTAALNSRVTSRVGRRRSSGEMIEAALAAFAHEVRTPLTGILAISDLLATSDLDERERRWVDTIKAGAEHLAGLATVFVDAARSNNVKLDVRQDFFDLRTLAHNAGDSLAGRAAAKGLLFDVAISDRLPVFVIGDPVRLRAALENLIDNAVKFTGSGKVTLKIVAQRAPRAKAKSARNGQHKGKVGIAFRISDSGIGISLAEIKRLFRPFSQANVGIAQRFGGAGLGLSSVKQLARAMGGDIVVAQRRGGGTIFTLTVTLARAKGPIALMSGGDPDAAALPGDALRLLSVEDNPFGRVVLNAILTELGHHADFIGRGEIAADRVMQGGFDAVLMDMVLPGIDGVEAIRQLRALPAPFRDIAIIGVSGRGHDEAASRQAGANAFIVKPVSPRALATALLEARHRAAAAT